VDDFDIALPTAWGSDLSPHACLAWFSKDFLVASGFGVESLIRQTADL